MMVYSRATTVPQLASVDTTRGDTAAPARRRRRHRHPSPGIDTSASGAGVAAGDAVVIGGGRPWWGRTLAPVLAPHESTGEKQCGLVSKFCGGGSGRPVDGWSGGGMRGMRLEAGGAVCV